MISQNRAAPEHTRETSSPPKLLFLLLLLLAVACGGAPNEFPEDPPEQPPVTEPEPIEEPPTVAPPEDTAGVHIIFDTDFGIDVDDAGALAVLHTFMDRGDAELLAVIANVNDKYSPGAIDAVNTYYGRPDIPIGQNPKPQYSEAYPYWRDHSPRFIQDLATEFPNDMDPSVPPPSAVSLYRQILASQPDESVTVVAVGFLQNLADLMASEPDAYSRLDGLELIRRKVKQLVLMGGQYPSSTRDLYLTGGRDMSPTPAIQVIEEWPTVIVFNTGNVCEEILTGRTLASETPPANPVREAYKLFFNEEGKSRSSWDLCSVLYAVHGLSGPEGEPYFGLVTDEHLVLDESGYSEWTTPSDPRHKRLIRIMPKLEMEATLEALMTEPPGEASRGP